MWRMRAVVDTISQIVGSEALASTSGSCDGFTEMTNLQRSIECSDVSKKECSDMSCQSLNDVSVI
jgi:hypothetical protein